MLYKSWFWFVLAISSNWSNKTKSSSLTTQAVTWLIKLALKDICELTVFTADDGHVVKVLDEFCQRVECAHAELKNISGAVNMNFKVLDSIGRSGNQNTSMASFMSDENKEISCSVIYNGHNTHNPR